MDRTIYRSKIDWWVWTMVAFYFTVLTVVSISGMNWVYFLINAIGFGIVFYITMFGVWYAVDGDELIVYRFCRPRRLPIKKIKEIKNSRSFLSAPAISTKRLAITFTDHTVLRSYLPLEISPKDSEGFVRHLLEVNPDIQVTG